MEDTPTIERTERGHARTWGGGTVTVLLLLILLAILIF